MGTVGQDIAKRSIAIRNRYGRNPVHDYQYGMEHSIVTWPEQDPAIEPTNTKAGVPDIQDYTKMSEKQLGMLPVNREDWRRRHRPLLPRAMRLDTYARRINKGEKGDDE